MYGVNCKTVLSAKSKYILGNIMFSGILKEIERGELDKEVLQQMINFYNETCIMGVNHLVEKINKS